MPSCLPFKRNDININPFVMKGNPMVFISHNNIRKCKWCDKEVKKNLTSGRNKGYYRTCGSKECTKRNFKDAIIIKARNTLNSKIENECFVCGNSFISECVNHKKYCRECVPDASWRSRAFRYGIGKKQWDELLDKQNGKCKLCERNPEVVDHCHKKKEVRGLLCNLCNVHLSVFNDGVNWINRALEYLGRKENASIS